jgi:ABC-2 type transport system ATP-binding protein
MDFALEIHDLTVSFNSRGRTFHAVDKLNLSIRPGTVFGFIGPNGAGKTTTMHVMLGFQAPSSGHVRIFGTDVRESIARRRIGYLAEHPDTYRFLTGRELLLLTSRFFRMPRAMAAKRVSELLDQVHLVEAADRRIATYSRGMMQRICLAQALLNDPDLVILDEPTGGLDPLARVEVRNLMADLRKRGKTIFFSSHELSEVETICDQVAILSKGKLVAEGALSKIVPPGRNLEKYFLEITTS